MAKCIICGNPHTMKICNPENYYEVVHVCSSCHMRTRIEEDVRILKEKDGFTGTKREQIFDIWQSETSRGHEIPSGRIYDEYITHNI